MRRERSVISLTTPGALNCADAKENSSHETGRSESRSSATGRDKIKSDDADEKSDTKLEATGRRRSAAGAGDFLRADESRQHAAGDRASALHARDARATGTFAFLSATR